MRHTSFWLRAVSAAHASMRSDGSAACLLRLLCQQKGALPLLGDPAQIDVRLRVQKGAVRWAGRSRPDTGPCRHAQRRLTPSAVRTGMGECRGIDDLARADFLATAGRSGRNRGRRRISSFRSCFTPFFARSGIPFRMGFQSGFATTCISLDSRPQAMRSISRAMAGADASPGDWMPAA